MSLLPEIVLDVLVIEGALGPDDIVRHVNLRLEGAHDENDILDALLTLQSAQRVAVTASHSWEARSTPSVEAQATRANSWLHSEVSYSAAYIPQGPLGAAFPRKTPRINFERSRWADFRRLCAYYIDCVREDDSPSVRAYPERIGEQWVPLHQAPDWGRLESTKDGFCRPIAAAEVRFVTEGKKRGSRQYLGYPCELVHPRDPEKSKFWSPIFLLPLDVEFHLDRVSVRPAGLPGLNPAWSKFSLRTPEKRRIFCELVGLTVVFDEEKEELTAMSSEQVAFAEMARRAGRFLVQMCREPILPDALTPPSTENSVLRAGIYNHAMLVNGTDAIYTAGLLKDLAKVLRTPDEYLDRTALVALFPHEPPAMGGPLSVREPPPPCAEDPERVLNPAQRRAVERALSSQLTVITGPPGTGKSAVVSTVLLNQALAEAPALLASRNHQALDAVEPRLNALAQHKELLIRPRRAGSFFTFKWKDFLKKLLNQPAIDARSIHVAERDQLHKRLIALEGVLTQTSKWHECARRLAVATREVDTTWATIPAALQLEDAIARFQGGAPAAVSRKREQFMELATPAQGTWKRLLRWLFRGRHRKALATALSELDGWLVARSTLDFAPESVSDQLSEWESAWDTWEAVSKGRVTLLTRAEAEAEAKALPDLHDLTARLGSLREQAGQLTESLLVRIADAAHQTLSQQRRSEFAGLRAKAENFGEAAAHRGFSEHLQGFLDLYPLWAITSLSAHSSLPLEPASFDLLVVDEASQSDIASVVPLLYRARRSLIVGDPMQLSHVTSLDPRAEARLLTLHRLLDDRFQRFSYRVNSLYDMAASSPTLDAGPVLLDQHYRCHPSIAHYTSETFYRRALRVCTSGRPWAVPKGQKAGIQWTAVAGGIDSSGGTGAHSELETAQVIHILQEMAGAGFKGTVGVVTPFRRQSNRLQDAIARALEEETQHLWALRVGTAHAFQGDERDVILLSLCCGPDMSPGTLSFVTRSENLFNVAVTRARAVLHVVGDFAWARAEGPSFIRRLAMLSAELEVTTPAAAYESIWEERLDTALRGRGILTHPQLPVAGRRLDLAVLRPNIKLDIEVDGEAYHREADGSRKPDDLWRDHQLRALGWKIKRFWVYELREDIEHCASLVSAILESSNE